MFCSNLVNIHGRENYRGYALPLEPDVCHGPLYVSSFHFLTLVTGQMPLS